MFLGKCTYGVRRMWKSPAGVAILFSTFLGAGAAGTNSVAGDLVYTPINPSFGGNVFNSSHLLALANSQNQPKREEEERKEKERAAKAAKSATSANFDRFLQSLQSKLYSSLAQQVSNAISDPNSNATGKITFHDQEVSYVKTDTEIILTVTDLTTGQESMIIVPVVPDATP
jgi:curli production assembly/transport component CsgF